MSGVGGRGLGGAGSGGGVGVVDLTSSSSSSASSVPLLDLDFIKRLVHYFNPPSNQFSAISTGREDFDSISAAGVHLLEYLAEFGGGGASSSSSFLGGGDDGVGVAREVM